MVYKLDIIINQLMAKARISGSELSRRTGIPIPTIKKVRSGENKNPTLSTIEPLAKYFSLTVSQLIGEENFDKAYVKTSPFYPSAGFSQVPIITWEEINNWPETQKEEHKKVIATYPFSENSYAVIVTEENWPFMPGTLLLIEPIAQPCHLDFVIVKRKNKNNVIVRRYLIDDSVCYLKPMTEDYKISILTEEHIIIGVVIEAKTYLKKDK